MDENLLKAGEFDNATLAPGVTEAGITAMGAGINSPKGGSSFGFASDKAVVPEVTAERLTQPTTPVTVPQPKVAEEIPTAPVDSVRNDLSGFITAQSEEAKRLQQLRDEQASFAGDTGLSSLFQKQLNDAGQPQNMNALKDIELQLAGLAETSMGTQSDIARAAGQTTGQGQREISAEEARANVKSYGLAARASVLRGNIQMAAQLASQAVQFAYQDRTLRNQNMQQQITSLQSVVDGQTAQLLEKDKREYEQDNMEIANAMSSVNAATSSGFATADDIDQMTSLSGNPQAQKRFADKIIAKATRTMYQNELAATYASAARATQGITDQAQSAAVENGVFVEKASNAIQKILDNPMGVSAATGGTAFGRTALSEGFESAKKGFLAGTAGGAAAGTVIPGAGTIAGGAIGGILGFGAGLTGGTVAAASQKTDVLGAMSFLTNSTTFSEMRRLKQSGVTFGSLTEGERKAIGASADNLISILEVDDSGQVVSINATEDTFYQYLNDYNTRMTTYQDELVRQAGGLTTEDINAIDTAGQ